MTKRYLDEKEIPKRHYVGTKARWPYKEWAEEIPEGKAIELEVRKGEKCIIVASTIRTALARYNYTHIQVALRGDRLFIVNKKPEVEDMLTD